MSEVKYKGISFSIGENLHKKLLFFCKKTEQPLSSVLRQAVYEFLSNCSFCPDEIDKWLNITTTTVSGNNYYDDD